MPVPRKYPIRIWVNGSIVSVRPMGGNLFCSKKQIYFVEYDVSGTLKGELVGDLPLPGSKA